MSPEEYEYEELMIVRGVVKALRCVPTVPTVENVPTVANVPTAEEPFRIFSSDKTFLFFKFL